MLERVLCNALSEHLLNNQLLPAPFIPDHNRNTCGDITGDTATQDHGSQRFRSNLVVNTPGSATESHLEQRVAVE